ncbi:MAG: BrnT family toxin [Gemmatimonadaceae bacterium]|jgi:hypothetical protein
MLDIAALLADAEGFDWDAGNIEKNVLNHGVTRGEAEEIFFFAPIVLLEDAKHSVAECRFLIFGPTATGRLLTAAFTLRRRRIRIISVRDMSRQERRRYAEVP